MVSAPFMLLLLALSTFQILVCNGYPHHDHDPVIRFLKDLRRARKYGSASASSLIPKDASDSAQVAATNQDPSSIRVGVAGPDGLNEALRQVNSQAQLEQTLQQISSQLPTQPPYNIESVNTGLRTLLGGVNQGSLAEILRGSFTFTQNDNVRSVANTVIDSIFGARSAGATA